MSVVVKSFRCCLHSLSHRHGHRISSSRQLLCPPLPARWCNTIPTREALSLSLSEAPPKTHSLAVCSFVPSSLNCARCPWTTLKPVLLPLFHPPSYSPHFSPPRIKPIFNQNHSKPEKVTDKSNKPTFTKTEFHSSGHTLLLVLLRRVTVEYYTG